MQWEAALGLLREMPRRSLQPDVISCSAAISACEEGVQWEAALGLLQEMPSCGHQPEIVSWGATILAVSSACAKVLDSSF